MSRRGKVLVIEHATVLHVIRAAASRLASAGCEVEYEDSLTFNSLNTKHADAEVILVSNASICDGPQTRRRPNYPTALEQLYKIHVLAHIALCDRGAVRD